MLATPTVPISVGQSASQPRGQSVKVVQHSVYTCEVYDRIQPLSSVSLASRFLDRLFSSLFNSLLKQVIP